MAVTLPKHVNVTPKEALRLLAANRKRQIFVMGVISYPSPDQSKATEDGEMVYNLPQGIPVTARAARKLLGEIQERWERKPMLVRMQVSDSCIFIG